VHSGASDELLDLLLALSAERALEKVTTFPDTCHQLTPLPQPRRSDCCRRCCHHGPARPRRSTLSCTPDGTARTTLARRPLPSGASGRPYLGPALEARQNLVHDAVLFRFVRREVLVPLHVPPDLLLAPAAVHGDDALHRRPHPQDLAGLDLQVAGLAVAALGGGLVEQEAGVRQAHPLVLGARGGQLGGGRGG